MTHPLVASQPTLSGSTVAVLIKVPVEVGVTLTVVVMCLPLSITNEPELTVHESSDPVIEHDNVPLLLVSPLKSGVPAV